jgi:cyclophilin family peptidyl-prolyl cis-trans isomerase/protein-disulfide isomerase
MLRARKIIFLCATAALFLTACGSNAGSQPTVAAAPPQPTNSESASFPEMICTSISNGNAVKDYLPDSPYGAVAASDWVRGPSDATITLVEYGDFQCEKCREFAETLAQLEAKYPNDVRVVYRHFPVIGSPEQPLHDKAAAATIAAEAAGRQGKFWEMHDLLFAKQPEWLNLGADDFSAWLLEQANELGINTEEFNDDLQNEDLAAIAQAAWEHGQELKIRTSPFILIYGIPYTGPIDFFSLDTTIQLDLLAKRQFTSCPPMQLEPGVSYTATLHTEKGDIVIELLPDVAPMAVNSFIFLAEHNWFDNVTFHRVLPGFVAQAGDPTGSGYGGPGYTFAIEPDASVSFDRAGLLAMANSGPTSNGSQFFITLGPAPHLNGQFTIFGEVIQGMDVVESLTPRDPSQQAGLPPGDLILDVTIEAH